MSIALDYSIIHIRLYLNKLNRDHSYEVTISLTRVQCREINAQNCVYFTKK